MARKQSDYLASLLSDDADLTPPALSTGDEGGVSAPVAAVNLTVKPSAAQADRPSDAPSPPSSGGERSVARAGLSLLGRENALARVASGEVRQVTQLLLDPARVRVWEGNARIQTQLSEENCRDLIDSILAEGGQKVPAVVRHLSGDPDHEYELIAGTRRHFAITWLRAHSYPDMKLLAQVADLDDEAAFRLADIENRARKDISDIERARNYAEALDLHYGGKAVRMAERLNLSKGWLSKMLKAASIPDKILNLFDNFQDIALNPAYRLALALDDKDRAKAIGQEANRLSTEQSRRRSEGLPPVNGATILARLMEAKPASAVPDKSLPLHISGGALGRTILSVKSVTRQGVTLHLPMASGATDEEITQAVRQILDDLRLQGVSVR